MRIYEDVDYACSRLNGSVVRLQDGTPVEVVSVRGRDRVTCFKWLYSGVNREITVTLQDLNIDPVPLGMVNNPNGRVGYASRRPTRHYKQGLNSHNFYLPRMRLLHSSYEVAATIRRKFPNLETAVDLLENEEVQEVAFCPEFYLSKSDGGIVINNYRGVVGDLRVGRTGVYNPQLHQKYQYLQEEMESYLA